MENYYIQIDLVCFSFEEFQFFYLVYQADFTEG